MYIEKKTLKSAFYIRVSTEDQADMNGKELQLTGLTALVESKGVLDNGSPVIAKPLKEHIYIDEISGTTTLEERPAFNRLMEDVVTAPSGVKPFDVILVYKIDRFARRLRILLETIDFFDKYSLQFISAHESIDTSTPFGKAILGITGVIAELELATIRERTHAGREEAARKGVLMSRKYGLKSDENKKVVIVEEEARVVKQIFDLFVYRKYSKNKIANILKEERVATPGYSAVGKSRNPGKSKNPIWFWNSNEITRILKDDIYIGDYYYNKTSHKKPLKKDKWKLSPTKLPQIIDDITFKKAQDILQASKHTRKLSSKHLYLLSGILRCDACYDAEIDTRGRVTWNGVSKKYGDNKKSFYYQCRRVNITKASTVCTALPLPANELEGYVSDYILNLLKDPKPVIRYQQELKSSKLAESELKKSEEYLINLINSVPVMKERLKEQHLVGLITTQELNEQIKDVSNRLQNNNKRLIAVRKQLANNHIADIYSNSLEIYSSKYTGAIEKLKRNRKELYDVIHTLVEEIVVYTRDVKEDDKIAGKKRTNQQVPCRLEIKLRLPQDFLSDLVEEQERLYNEEVEKTLIKQRKSKKKQGSSKEEFQVKNHSW